jgi:DNA-binding IclR family transcriptional regulator
LDRSTSLIKALDILTLLGGSGCGFTIAEVAFAMNAPRSTVVRVINTLITYGLVEKEKGRCRPSSRFYDWARPERHAVLIRQYRPVLQEVARVTGELVLLGLQQGKGIIHIDFIESDHAIRVAPAPLTRHSLRNNALGKLALSRRADLAQAWIRDNPAFAAELEDVRRTGVAWNREESVRGMIAMAMPGFSNGPTDPMLAIAWPEFRFSDKAARTAEKAVVRALKKHFPQANEAARGRHGFTT